MCETERGVGSCIVKSLKSLKSFIPSPLWTPCVTVRRHKFNKKISLLKEVGRERTLGAARSSSPRRPPMAPPCTAAPSKGASPAQARPPASGRPRQSCCAMAFRAASGWGLAGEEWKRGRGVHREVAKLLCAAGGWRATLIGVEVVILRPRAARRRFGAVDALRGGPARGQVSAHGGP